VTAAQCRELLEQLDMLGVRAAPAGGGIQVAVSHPVTGQLIAVGTRGELRQAAGWRRRRRRRGRDVGNLAGVDGSATESDAGTGLGPPPPTHAYRPSAPQRRFVRVRDRCCRMPGCRRAPGRCDIDHGIAHADGGPTDCWNLCCPCRRHHRIKTFARGWRFEVLADGRLIVRTPSGISHHLAAGLVSRSRARSAMAVGAGAARPAAPLTDRPRAPTRLPTADSSRHPGGRGATPDATPRRASPSSYGEPLPVSGWVRTVIAHVRVPAQEAGGMYARSTTIDGKPELLEKGIAYVRDRVMPAVSGMDGYVGTSMLADRMSGRCIVTTSWEDAEALQCSAPGVRGMRARATDILQGPAQIEEWQIAVVHRRQPTGDGACTRVLWTKGDAGGTDRMLDAFRLGMLTRIEELPGFCSVSAMVDRSSGRSAIAVTYADRAAMDRAQEEALVIRQQFTREMGLAVTGAQAFDLVVAHLRVPETV
jgi:hypothetical protein